jgi:sugar lactone lactonase YvrE/enterochelin esterase-like enzyme
MKRARTLPILILSLAAMTGACRIASAADPKPGPDSMTQAGVPKGEVLKFSFENSKIFPGTYRDYWVYVPAQYTPDKPACLYVNQDGVQWNAPTVFDNLIAKKEMPVTIGVFVVHGRVRAADGSTALDRFNRSYEYDGLGDNYARFLVEELLPEVEKKKTSDGRAIHFSHNPNDRAIGGSSSGAVAAWTAAWERPDQFSRVWTAIGTYVGLRGADVYPTLLRKYEPKRLRIFLQDGSADQNIYAGDWWFANQMMERALTFAGYEVQHSWGEGGHSGQHGTAIFPDVMRYLWKDWPKPVQVGKSRNAFLKDMLVAGQDWQALASDYQNPTALAGTARGEVYFTDLATGKLHRLGADGKAMSTTSGTKKSLGQAAGPDGRLYAVSADGKVVAYDAEGKSKTVADGIRGNDLVVASNGNVYVTEAGPAGSSASKVWLIKPGGKKQQVDSGLLRATGITLSPDQTLLYVADAATRWVYAYQVQKDGTLQAKQQYYWLHVPDVSGVSSAGSMCVDRDGRLYVSTNLGLQVCDQAGRVNCILPLPSGAVTSVTFGGANSDTLYATSGGTIYQRKLAIKGTHAWETPNKPAAPRL